MPTDEERRWQSRAINVPRLRACSSDALLDLHLAAIEHGLATPISIRNKDDIKSRQYWSGAFEPFEHQVRNLITFCRRAPVALIADDVGLGKTISAGLVLSELMARKKVRRALIVAPKLLLEQWCEELQSKFRIEARHASGGDLNPLIRTTARVVVTTYETARSRFDDLSRGLFDMIVLDEAHKLRNLYGTPQAPQVAEAIRASFRKSDFKYVLMLTATPIQNRLWDIYSLVDLLSTARGHENPLGTPAHFSSHYVQDAAATARELKPGRREEFRRQIADYMVRTSRRDSRLVFPERKVKTLGCPAGPAEQRLADLVGDALPRMNALARSSLAQALMSSPAALVAQLQNMAANGTVPAVLPQRAAQIAEQVGPGCKMERLRAFIRELAREHPRSWRAVVFTRRKETQELIARTLAGDGVKVGFIRGGQAEQNQRSIKALWAESAEVNLLVSTDAGAEGVNLQVANVVINYDLPWNPMVVEQRIGRVQRLASKHRNIVVVNLVVADSVEETVVARLIAKLQAISETIGDIEGILETSSMSEDGLEDTIQSLVVKAMMGQDVSAATAKVLESIKRAKELYQQGREEVDRNLGGLDAMHSAGPEMPELERVTPRLSVADFVREALVADGASLAGMGDGRWMATAGDQPPFIVTFNEGDPDLVEAGLEGEAKAPVVLYGEGRPPFERLVAEWSKRDAVKMVDWTDADGSIGRAIVSKWAEALGPDAVVLGWEPGKRRMCVVGEATVRASASVAIDRYEKLVGLKIGEDAVRTALNRASGPKRALRSDVELEDHVAGLPAVVRRAVSEDDDVTAFCEFYESRRDEESGRAADRREAEMIRKRFQPALAAEVVAARGHAYEEVSGVAQVGMGRGSSYAVPLTVRTGTMQVLAEPERGGCAVTGRSVPVTFLAPSRLSGKLGMRHLLVASERSGRLGLPAEVATCEVSGARLLSDEVAASDVSGRVVDRLLLRTSSVSGRSGLEDEMGECAFTGVAILKAEGRSSDVSGKVYRIDQEAMSVVSGIRGHQSEFIQCTASRDWILEAESGISAATGSRVRKDLLVTATSGGVALEGEIVPCAFTGTRLLPAEASRSEVSGKWYRVDEGARSSVSGVAGHKSEFEMCEQAGVLALPTELARSSVSGKRVCRSLLSPSAISGRLALPEELLQCEVTHAKVIQSEALRSEVSGKWYRADESAKSSVSGVAGHKSEFEVCEQSGVLVLPAELDRSAVSGKRVCRSLLRPSAVSGRLALSEELVQCEFTHQKVLQTEALCSEVSGKWYRADEGVKSSVSGVAGHKSEFEVCERTGVLALPAELDRSAVSGKRVCRSLLRPSAVSGRLALAEDLVQCEFTEAKVLQSEALRSEVSGRLYRSDQQGSSTRTGARGHASEFQRCEATGESALPAELGVSSVSGRRVRRELLVASAKDPSRVGLADEAVVCAVSGKRLLSDEVETSAVSGKVADASLMSHSGKRGQPALPGELVRCEVTGTLLLPSEAGQCQVTGKLVDAELLGVSGYSGKTALKSLLRVCPETSKAGLESELGRCAVTGQFYDKHQLVECAATREWVCKSLTVQSAASGRILRRDRAVIARSGRVGHPDELASCLWTGWPLLADETVSCRLTGVMLGKASVDAQGICSAHGDMLGRLGGIVPDVGQGLADVRAVLEGVGIRPARAWLRKSPSCSTVAVVAEVRSMLGLRRKHVVFFMEGRSARGQIALVSIRDGAWSMA